MGLTTLRQLPFRPTGNEFPGSSGRKAGRAADRGLFSGLGRGALFVFYGASTAPEGSGAARAAAFSEAGAVLLSPEGEDSTMTATGARRPAKILFQMLVVAGI